MTAPTTTRTHTPLIPPLGFDLSKRFPGLKGGEWKGMLCRRNKEHLQREWMALVGGLAGLVLRLADGLSMWMLADDAHSARYATIMIKQALALAWLLVIMTWLAFYPRIRCRARRPIAFRESG
jgi:hypothetical protein